MNREGAYRDAPGVIAIIRLRHRAAGDELFEAIVAGGVRWIEVTLPTPGSEESIARWTGRHGVRVGAGTVRTPGDVDRAAAAGAQFLVTPATSLSVLDAARSHGLPIVCGALTPTEIETATELGADWVKVFPIHAVGGIEYLRSIAAPLSSERFVPTGGVTISTIAAYAAAGCAGVGVGSSLVDEALVEAAESTGDWSVFLERSRALTEAWDSGLTQNS